MTTLIEWYLDYSEWVVKFVAKNLKEGLLEGESLESWDSDFVDFINEAVEAKDTDTEN